MEDHSLLREYMKTEEDLTLVYPFILERYLLARRFGITRDIEAYGAILSWMGLYLLVQNICSN